MNSINNFSVIAKQDGIVVSSYLELLEKISDLAYDYPNHILYFRGQTKDYRTKEGRSTLYPSIYRGTLSKDDLRERFRLLDGASKALVDVSKRYYLKGVSEMRKKRLILWSILQHYEICDTPLLDITHSLRTACTFALNGNNEGGYIYVLALPYLTNRITNNSEEDILLVRLLSISPPAAKRPFYQEGYVIGTPDITYNYENKSELDVVNRLVAKFKIVNSDRFWSKDFTTLSDDFIYPKEDTFLKIKDEVIDLKSRGFYENTVGDFLKLWNQLEQSIKKSAQMNEYDSIIESYNKLIRENKSYLTNRSAFNEIRVFRNNLVHETKQVSENEIEIYIHKIQELLKNMKIVRV